MGLVEVAHAGDGDWQAWCERLLDAARSLFSSEHLNAMVMRRAETRYEYLGGASTLGGLMDRYQEIVPGVPASDLDPFGRYQGYVGTMATTLRGERPPPGMLDFIEMFDAEDVLGLVAMGDDVSLSLACPHPKRIRLASRDRRLLTQATLHLEAGLRLRLNPGAEVAVLRPDGRLLHAAGVARDDAATRSHLSAHVAGVERSRAGRRRGSSECIDAWSALISGAWSLVERTEADGARHYAVLETPRSRRLRALSPLEMQAVELSARGLTGKAVAYALGVSGGSVSKALSDAAFRLGIGGRTELVQLVARLLDAGPRRAVDAQLTSAEQGVLALVRLGWANAQIARSRGRSEHTVANQIGSLLRKLQVPSRRALATSLVSASTPSTGT